MSIWKKVLAVFGLCYLFAFLCVAFIGVLTVQYQEFNMMLQRIAICMFLPVAILLPIIVGAIIIFTIIEVIKS